MQIARYERGERKLGYTGLCELLTQWRNSAERPWLRDAPAHPLQQALKDLERAYRNFFARRAGFPRFKKRGQCDRFRYPDPLSHKVKFSHNWKKAKARVQRIHARIGNARSDYLHKATSAISKNHAMVCIEDLRVRNIRRSDRVPAVRARFLHQRRDHQY